MCGGKGVWGGRVMVVVSNVGKTGLAFYHTYIPVGARWASSWHACGSSRGVVESWWREGRKRSERQEHCGGEEEVGIMFFRMNARRKR